MFDMYIYIYLFIVLVGMGTRAGWILGTLPGGASTLGLLERTVSLCHAAYRYKSLLTNAWADFQISFQA